MADPLIEWVLYWRFQFFDQNKRTQKIEEWPNLNSKPWTQLISSNWATENFLSIRNTAN